MNRREKPQWQKDIARERIEILFNLADKEFPGKYANRYVELARKIGMRYNIRIPSQLKRKFCKKCHSFLKFGSNSIHRTNRNDQAVIIVCKECNHKMRYPYRKEKMMNKLLEKV